MAPLPESAAPNELPIHSSAPFPSLSLSIPQVNKLSIHSKLEMELMHTHTEYTEVIIHEIDWLLHHIHELDYFKGQENHEISKNIWIIWDELYDLSEYVCTCLVATERVVVTEQQEPPAVPHRDHSISAVSVISNCRN